MRILTTVIGFPSRGTALNYKLIIIPRNVLLLSGYSTNIQFSLVKTDTRVSVASQWYDTPFRDQKRMESKIRFVIVPGFLLLFNDAFMLRFYGVEC